MKKFFLIILISEVLFSCSQGESQRFVKRTSDHWDKGLIRSTSKFSLKSKPSETHSVAKHSQNESKIIVNEVVEVTPDDDLPTSGGSKSYNSGQYSGYFKVGNPYSVFGVDYIPQNYEEYEETGTASWYGDEFHGKKTANGETYNMTEMTAAHTTLPLPSLVRVTNLVNGKNVVVRVNDRGPFAKNRVIDVSEKAAQNLGFKNMGTTKVKVELLRKETDDMLRELKLVNGKP